MTKDRMGKQEKSILFYLYKISNDIDSVYEPIQKKALIREKRNKTNFVNKKNKCDLFMSKKAKEMKFVITLHEMGVKSKLGILSHYRSKRNLVKKGYLKTIKYHKHDKDHDIIFTKKGLDYIKNNKN